MWDYVPTRFYLCKTRGGPENVGCTSVDGDLSMRWTRSPPNLHLEHVLKSKNKWRGLTAHRATRGRLGMIAIFIERTASRSSSRSSSIGRWTLLTIMAYLIARSWPSSHLKLNQTAWRIHGRTPRSRFDRTAIMALPSWNQRHDLGARFQFKMAREISKIEAR